MEAVNSEFIATAVQTEGKWKRLVAALRNHNNISGNSRTECPFYNEIAERYGYRPNVQLYVTTSSSGEDYKRVRAQDSWKWEVTTMTPK